MKQIKSISTLKKECLKQNREGCVLLNYGLRSSKVIHFDPKEKKSWAIHHLIDDSTELLTEAEFKETNIAKAIKFKAFFLD